MQDNTHFQYCPKLAVFNETNTEILLCRRKGELDYDGVFSLIGGKMEHKDTSIVEAIRREKNEEVGNQFLIRLLPYHSIDVFFSKKDGNMMILPHYYAQHLSGNIVLNEEYSDSVWISLDRLANFTPMIENVRWIAPLLLRAASAASPAELLQL